MVFIWRGFGLIVPIFFFISAWITSYWIEDTTLGNPHFIGWSMLWCSIPLTLIGLGAMIKPEPDENGVVAKASPHDFFWIPVLIWGLVFLGGSIFLINKEGKPSSDQNESDIYANNYEEEVLTKINLNLYNSTPETITVSIWETDNPDILLDEIIEPEFIRYQSFFPGDYIIEMNESNGPFSIPKPNYDSDDYLKYHENWLVLGDGIDLVLVDVSKACREDINKEELAEIDWSSLIKERYDGKNLIEVMLFSSRASDVYTVYRPGISLPLELADRETVFALIPVAANEKVTEEYLDEMVIDLCY